MKTEEDVALVRTQRMVELLKARKDLADNRISPEEIDTCLPMPKQVYSQTTRCCLNQTF